jgi:hypothetical protein
MIQKQSFLSNLFGDAYLSLKSVAMWVSLIGSSILIVLYVLSSFFHAGIISSLLNLTSGTSLLFIGYIAAIIVLADIRVEVDEPEYYYHNEAKEPKPFKYKLTIVWGVILLVLGIVAIYYSNRYRNHYSFECETFMVDEKDGIYHLDWNDDCSVAEKAESLEEMQGYQINKAFKFCEECQDVLEDVGP